MNKRLVILIVTSLMTIAILYSIFPRYKYIPVSTQASQSQMYQIDTWTGKIYWILSNEKRLVKPFQPNCSMLEGLERLNCESSKEE